MTGTTNIRRRRPLMAAAVALGLTGFALAAHAGAPGDRRACVSAAGALVGVGGLSKGAIGSVLVAPSNYEIRFDRVVTRCVKVATLGFCGRTTLAPRPGEITVAQSPTLANAVLVRTYTSAGVADPREFHLYVDCD